MQCLLPKHTKHSSHNPNAMSPSQAHQTLSLEPECNVSFLRTPTTHCDIVAEHQCICMLTQGGGRHAPKHSTTPTHAQTRWFQLCRCTPRCLPAGMPCSCTVATLTVLFPLSHPRGGLNPWRLRRQWWNRGNHGWTAAGRSVVGACLGTSMGLGPDTISMIGMLVSVFYEK